MEFLLYNMGTSKNPSQPQMRLEVPTCNYTEKERMKSSWIYEEYL